MLSLKRIISVFLLVFAGYFFVLPFAFGQSETPTPTPDNSSQLAQKQKEIEELEKKLKEVQGQSKTLSSQISVMDNQIRLTELRVSATEEELETLNENINIARERILTLEESLNKTVEVLLNRIVATYQVGSLQPLEVMLSSNGITDAFTRLNYLRLVQLHDKQLIYETQQAKNDYINQKEIFEEEKTKVEKLQAQLVAYTKQLDNEKAAKQSLLSVTKNDEKRYQQLLSEARRQIASFKSFASSQGGSSILPPQPSPDGWFFNQRDERWGNNNIGSSPEKVWEVGCLVAVTAMLRKQRGEGITPADVARQSQYFFSNTALMLIPWNDGRFSSRGKDMGAIDSRLASGQPVIVGLYAGPFGTHFIVLKSGSSGNYTMNDPWNGPDLRFSDYYSDSQIFQYGYLL